MQRVFFHAHIRSFLTFSLLIPVIVSAQQISPQAEQRIHDLLAMKESLSPAQKKQSTDLVMAARSARGQSTGSVSSQVFKSLATAPEKSVLVDIKVHAIPAVSAKVVGVGGEVVHASQASLLITAKVPLNRMDEVADLQEVHWIRTAAKARTNWIPARDIFGQSLKHSSVALSDRRDQLVERLENNLPLLASNGTFPSLGALLNPFHISSFIGSVTSQGYISHAAKQVVNSGIDGTGIKVGVLSDSAFPDEVAALIATGDLPPDTVVLPGQAGPNGGENEGTAMMEIVHDLAPGAKLYFASAFNSESSFADNIRALRFTYGCDIIVDDVGYSDEGVFQDGPIADAVNAVVGNGALYFSAAGNDGNLTNTTSATWEGDFKGGRVVGDLGTIHLFGNSETNPLLYTSAYYDLRWSDPLGKSANDYDLFVADADGNIVASSTNSQTGSQDPYEFIEEDPSCETDAPTGYCPQPGDQLIVVLHHGEARALHLSAEGGELAFQTTGSAVGHNAGLHTFSVAATYWNSAQTGLKPFVGRANPTEAFSSDGPRKIFYKPDGTPITPGNFLFATKGGQTLLKPDATAADGVFTRTPGFRPFFGTSAAAPHAAAIAALVKSANPDLTNSEVISILRSTALDNMSAGLDRDGGHGVLMAAPAVAKALNAAGKP